MWISSIDFDGDRVSGELLNEPNELSNVRAGDRVEIAFADLEDWMLTTDGKVLGAFSVQVIRADMRRADRQAHDEAWGLDFGDPARVALPPGEVDHPMALNMVPSLVEFPTKNPGELRSADPAGRTMLHREALAGNACIVRALLERGADKHARDAKGHTPLDLARRLGWPAVESLLA
jgi:hypothetical protein